MTARADLPRIGELRGTGSGTGTGTASSPVLALLGGVHGDEPEGVLAVRSLISAIRPDEVTGIVRWAAPAHPAAWRSDSRAGPDDGENLARVFPGDPGGGQTQQVAAHLSAELITGADLLVDLHSAGRGFDMPLLAGYHSTGALAGRAGRAAAAFAAPLVWQHPDSAAGRSLSVAESMGIPSIYVEGRGGGRVRQHDLDAYSDGLRRVMAHLGMLADAPAGPPATMVRGDGDTDEGITAPAAGFFVTAVEVCDRVARGGLLGRIIDQDGTVLAEVPAPQAGVVMLLRRSTRVTPGDTLAIVGGLVPTGPAGQGGASASAIPELDRQVGP